MSSKIDLSGSPYFDDSDERKSDHYRTLFRAGRSVQVRELNELQAALQRQIERFGDSIYRTGTIINGCNFVFHDVYPYAKLSDNDVDGVAIDVSLFEGLIATNQDGLTARVLKTEEGLESDNPDLNTIYVKYRNAGNNSNTQAFDAGDILTFSDIDEKIHSVEIDSAGVGFTNSDPLVFTSALVVNVTSGSFTNGEFVTQPSLGSNLQIVNINTTLKAGNGHIVLTLKPRDVDLANATASSTAWSVEANSSIRNSGNTAVGSVIELLGSGAAGDIVTDASGRVITTVITNEGEGYEVPPNVRIRSDDNTTGLSSLVLTAKNYLAKVAVANVSAATGNGYAFGVSRGIIYQKGFFVDVDRQTIVVSKYNQSPSNVAVGFDTVAEFITSDEDDRLLDQVTGEGNELAPGADRLKLTPTLVLLDSANAASNNDFLTLVEWSEGVPFLQRREPVYSRLAEELGRRTAETSGDFVIDQFLVTTRSPSNNDIEGSHHSVVVDPGTAYVLGKRVETVGNYTIDVPKSTTRFITRASVGLGYGPYVRVKEVAGLFQHATGAQVELRSVARAFLSNTAAGTASSVGSAGNLLGRARIRSMIRESGVPGDPGAVYRLYLFDIRMIAGRNFRDVRSVHYDSTYDGSADVVLETNPTTNNDIAILHERANSALVFASGFDSISDVLSANYSYRTIDQTTTFANTGLLTKTLTAPGEEFPWAGTLTSSDMSDLYVVPVAASLSFSANLTGTVTLNTTSANLVGVGTTFLSELDVGDWVRPYTNSTNFDVRRVTKIVNNTLIVLDANGAAAFSGVNFKRTFPRFIPIPFGTRSGLTANVDVLGTTLTLNLGAALEHSGTVNTALGVTIKRVDPEPVTKTAVRTRYVKLRLSNNDATHVGPWCLGVPDAFRLRGVYRSDSSTVNTNSRNVTDSFYLDPNQNEDFYDLSFLYRRPAGSYRTKSSDWLLVEFDYMTRPDDGYFTYQSYTGTTSVNTLTAQDSEALATLTTSLSSVEIPEVPTGKGRRLDLVGAIDFRPAVANTAAPAATDGAAPTNPPYTVGFGNTADPANDKRFPVPASVFRANLRIFETRFDSVYLYNDIPAVVQGTPARSKRDAVVPAIPPRGMRLYDIEVPAYPSFPEHHSRRLVTLRQTRRIEDKRVDQRQASVILNENSIEQYQPRRYTMRDIASLDNRLRAAEYYITLTLGETDIFKKSIPSSIDPTLNRFKYGFFVDSFSDTSLQAENNPAYAARVESDKFLTPDVLRIPIGYKGGTMMPNYVDWEVIKQTYATDEEAEPPGNTVHYHHHHHVMPDGSIVEEPDIHKGDPNFIHHHHFHQHKAPGPSKWEGTMRSRIINLSASVDKVERILTISAIVGIDCKGLKPSTQHYLYPLHPYEDNPPGTIQEETVKQFNKDWGDPLITRAEGDFGPQWNNAYDQGKAYQLLAELKIQFGLSGNDKVFQKGRVFDRIANQMKNVEFVVRTPERTGDFTGSNTAILNAPPAISWASSIPVFAYHYKVCNTTYEVEIPIDKATAKDWAMILALNGYPSGNVIL